MKNLMRGFYDDIEFYLPGARYAKWTSDSWYTGHTVTEGTPDGIVIIDGVWGGGVVSIYNHTIGYPFDDLVKEDYRDLKKFLQNNRVSIAAEKWTTEYTYLALDIDFVKKIYVNGKLKYSNPSYTGSKTSPMYDMIEVVKSDGTSVKMSAESLYMGFDVMEGDILTRKSGDECVSIYNACSSQEEFDAVLADYSRLSGMLEGRKTTNMLAYKRSELGGLVAVVLEKKEISKISKNGFVLYPFTTIN